MSNDTVDRILSVEPAKRSHKGCAPKIRKLKLRHPELSHSDIARKVGCHPSNVTSVLKAFIGKGSEDDLRSFKDNKADVYDAIQRRLLLSVTDAKLAKAPMQSLVLSAAILEDKARLVRGLATGINVSVLMDVAEAIRNRAPSAPNPPAISVPSTIDAKL
jgi:hypothetical protein